MPRIDELLNESDEFEENIRQKLKLQDVQSIEELLSREEEISLDLTEWDLLFERIEAEIGSVPRSLLDECSLIESKSTCGISTGNPLVDQFFGGSGIPVGSITELVGRPSSGKSQICLHCAVHAVGTSIQVAPLHAIYIDCGQPMAVSRLSEICSRAGFQWNDVASHIHCFSVFEVTELISILDHLIHELHRTTQPFASFSNPSDSTPSHTTKDRFPKNVRLLFIDSLGPLLSTIICIGTFGDALLNRVMAQLTTLATRYALAVVVVNYVRPDLGPGQDIPGLGISWSYCSNLQIRVTSPQEEVSPGALEVIKSSVISKNSILKFFIIESGIHFFV